MTDEDLYHYYDFLLTMNNLGAAVSAGAAALVVTDDFNRADGNLSGNWTQLVGGQNLLIASNQCGSDQSSSYAATYWNAATFAANQYSQAVVKTTGAVGLAVRAQAGQDRQYYNCRLVFGALIIGRQNSSTLDDLASVSDPFTTDDVIRFEAEGTTLRVKRNGVEVLSITDATYAGGKPGIHIHFGTACRLDDWEGGDL